MLIKIFFFCLFVSLLFLLLLLTLLNCYMNKLSQIWDKQNISYLFLIKSRKLEILAAACGAGVTACFASPIGGEYNAVTEVCHTL